MVRRNAARLLGGLVVLALPFALAGCIDVKYGVVVAPDGSADLSQSFQMDVSALGGVDTDLDLASTEVFGSSEKAAEAEGWKLTRIQNEKSFGFTATKHVSELTGPALQPDATGGLTVKRGLFKTRYVLDLTLPMSTDTSGSADDSASSADESATDTSELTTDTSLDATLAAGLGDLANLGDAGLGGLGADALNSLVTATFEAELPGRIISSNAEKTDGSTLSWKLALGEKNRLQAVSERPNPAGVTLAIVVGFVVLALAAFAIVATARRARNAGDATVVTPDPLPHEFAGHHGREAEADGPEDESAPEA